MGGGDLLNLLIERDVFEEDFTRFYVAEVRFHLLKNSGQFLTFCPMVVPYDVRVSFPIDGIGDRIMPQARIHSQGYKARREYKPRAIGALSPDGLVIFIAASVIVLCSPTEFSL